MPCPSWLVSYPKSGTTWMRFLLAHLIGRPPDTSADLASSIPSIHDADTSWTDRLEQDGWLATHKAFDAHAARYGERMRCVVHVVRHPADAILSGARYFCLTTAGEIARKEGRVDGERLEKLVRDYLTVVLAHGSSPRHRRVGMGSWGAHTEGWLARHDAQPTHFVRYEDLKREPAAEIRRLAAFLRRPITEVQAAQIAERYDLKRMRTLQEREIAKGVEGQFYLGQDHQAAYDLGLRFVGRGAVGGGLELGPDAMARLYTLFGPTMDRLGYTTDPDAPVVEAQLVA